MSTVQERVVLQPKKMHNKISDTYSRAFANTLKKFLFWKRKRGPFVKTSRKGWWKTVRDCESHTEDYFAWTRVEGVEAQDNSLLLEALDYIVSLKANTYFPAFDKDRHGLPNIASLIMGHRLYQSASLKTFRPNRSTLVALLDDYPHEHPHNVSFWRPSMRRLLAKFLIRSEDASPNEKSDLFMSHPIPECASRISEFNNSQSLGQYEGLVSAKVHACPI